MAVCTTQSSDEWYLTEGYRAVNQALGRVIRHINDFGVVALLDERFANVKREYFPAWLRSSIKIFDRGSEFIAVTRKFFSEKKLEVKKSSMQFTLRDSKSGKAVSGGFSRKRPNIVSSTEVRHECVMEYGLYTNKPVDVGANENLSTVDRNSLLSICTAEELLKSKKAVSLVEKFNAGIESEVTSTSQSAPLPSRKKLKLAVSSDLLE
ncbi:hypothetical protein COOONC_01753 [Cooperia oncophora]